MFTDLIIKIATHPTHYIKWILIFTIAGFLIGTFAKYSKSAIPAVLSVFLGCIVLFLLASVIPSFVGQAGRAIKKENARIEKVLKDQSTMDLSAISESLREIMKP